MVTLAVAELPQEPSDGGDARVVRHLEDRPGHLIHSGQLVFELFGVGNHGAEFVESERPAVETRPLLSEHDRPG